MKSLKIIIIIIIIMVAHVSVFAQNREISLERGTLNHALQKAKQTGKLVFVDCNTTWCGPCKEMAATVFKTDSVADFFNSSLISVDLDMEKGEGLAALKTYKVGAFPSFLLLNGDGDLVYKFVGSMPANEFMEQIRQGIKPDNKVAVMNKMYAFGNRDDKFIAAYIRLKIEMQEITQAQQIAKEYFNRLSEERRTALDNWFMFGENKYRLYLSDIHSDNFSYLAKNWKAFAKVVSRDTVEKRLDEAYRKIANYCLEGFYFKNHPYNKADFDEYRQDIRATELADKDQLLVLMDIAQAAGEKDKIKVSDILAIHIADMNAENQKVFCSFFAFCAAGNIIPIPKMAEIKQKILKTSKDEFLTGFVKTLVSN